MTDEIARMAAAFGLVAAAAAPVAVAARLLARRPVLPPFRRRSSPLGPLDVVVLFFVCQIAPAMWTGLARPAGVDPEARFRAMILGQAAALPTFLAVWAVLRVAAGGGVVLPRPRWAADVFTGVVGWVVIAPVTFAVYYAALAVLAGAGGAADEHPLKQIGPGQEPARILAFFLAACVLPAVYEELVFRRILLPWAVGPRYRPWAVVLVGVLLVAASTTRLGPQLFAVSLAAGLIVVQFGRVVWPRFPAHTATGVYATAMLFGVLHSAVWPSPVPLFVFGLGLGTLTVRTGSVVPAVVAHALFNAVSAVYLLRG